MEKNSARKKYPKTTLTVGKDGNLKGSTSRNFINFTVKPRKTINIFRGDITNVLKKTENKFLTIETHAGDLLTGIWNPSETNNSSVCLKSNQTKENIHIKRGDVSSIRAIQYVFEVQENLSK